MTLIVGSQALIRVAGPVRKPVDIDMFGTSQDAFDFMENNLRQEVVEAEWENSNKIILKGDRGAIIECETIQSNPTNIAIHIAAKASSIDGLHANKDWQYFLKMSHRFKKDSKHFLKTMQDIRLLRSLGAKIPEGFEELFKQREAETYTYSHPDLTVDKGDFFKQHETFYKYDHDTIHEAVAVGIKPAYTYYMKDGAQVMCDRQKFEELPYYDKLLGVLEESYVLALERSLIPNNFRPYPKVAFDMALEKVCTSITSGWFREFAWENYFQVQALYSSEFVDKFQDALKSGKIKPFERTLY